MDWATSLSDARRLIPAASCVLLDTGAAEGSVFRFTLPVLPGHPSLPGFPVDQETHV